MHIETDDFIQPPTPAERPGQGILTLFWGMIVRPHVTLAYLRDAGGSSWLWPAVLAALLLVVSLAVTAPISRAAIDEQLASQQEQFSERLSPEEQDQVQQMTELTRGLLFTVVIPAVTGVIGLAIAWAFRGGVLYLASLALGGGARFAAIFGMGVWTTLPDILRRLVTTVGTLASGRVLAPGLAFLVEAPEPGAIPPASTAVLQAFLAGVDVYLLWGLALTVIGVAVTARLSWRKGLLITLAYWLLTIGLKLGSVWIGVSFAAQFAPMG